MKYHLTSVKWPSLKNPQTLNAREAVEKREPSYTVGGNVNCYSQCGEDNGGSLQNWKESYLYNPEILLLGIYQKEKEKNQLKKTHVPQCSLEHYSQAPGHGQT